MEVDKEHIRHCMLYEFRRGSTPASAVRNITGVYPNAISHRQCCRWFERFREGNFDLSDRPKAGRPATVDMDLLKTLVETEPRVTTRELAEQMGTTHTSIVTHLHQLGKVNKRGVWVPHELTDEQKANRMSACVSLLARDKVEPLLERIVTCDEKWVLYDNVSARKQWLDRKQKPIPTPKAGLHPRKVLLSVWWDMRGVVFFELLPNNTTITADVYCRQLDDVHASLTSKRPALLNRKGVLLQQDGARPHTARVTCTKIRDLGWELLPHPAYSPDIAPSDYHLFRSMQHFLDGQRFTNRDDVERALTHFFASQPPHFYRDGIQQLPRRWEQVVANDGDYILD